MMLTFLDKLDDEQIANAEKVAKAARRAGVDPNLAVAIAFRESNLRANPPRGSSGEIGIMQIMPGTGRGMGYDEKKLQSVDDNIEAGIKYIKQGLQATGNDPKLASVYYNGGPGAVQALSSGQNPDPRVIEYVRAINGFGAFGKPAEPAAQPSAQPAPQPPAVSEDKPSFEPERQETDEEREARIQAAIDAQEKRMAQLGGAAAGAALSTGKGALNLGRSVIQGAGQAAGQGLQTGIQQAAGLPPSSPVPPGGLRQLGVPGTYPAATGPGSGVFNYSRNLYGLPEIEAARALDMSKQQGGAGDLATKRREALNQIRQQFPTERYIENPRFGGIMTPDPGAGGGPRAQYVQNPPSVIQPGPRANAPPVPQMTQLPPTQPIPTTPLQSVTQRLSALSQPIMSGLSAVGKYAVPPVALAGAAGEGVSLAQNLRREDPDYIKAALQATMAGSGLAALYPPLTLPAAGVGLTAAGIDYLRDLANPPQYRSVMEGVR
jgi:hypothetical protein